MSGPLSSPARLDPRAWRSAALAFVLFGGVGVVFLFGAAALGISGAGDVARWMGAGVHGPWGLPIAILSFAVLAFLGVPQFVLIAAAAVAFGPWLGSLYSWIGTLASALVGFALGRRFGARALSGLGGERVDRFTRLIARNGFLASLVVRLVPSAPFIVVNMAAGITPMRLASFALGTALGIVPKIALTAFAGHAALRGLSGQGPGSWIGLALAAVVWIGSAVVARAWLRRREAGRAGSEGGLTSAS